MYKAEGTGSQGTYEADGAGRQCMYKDEGAGRQEAEGSDIGHDFVVGMYKDEGARREKEMRRIKAGGKRA